MRLILLPLLLLTVSCRPAAPPVESGDSGSDATEPEPFGHPAHVQPTQPPPTPGIEAVEDNADRAFEELPELPPETRDVPRPRAYLRRSYRAAADALGRGDVDGARRILAAERVTGSLADLELDSDYRQYVNTRVLLLDVIKSYAELERGDPWNTDVVELRAEVEEILGVRRLDVDLALADVDARARTLRDLHQVLIYLELGQFADVSSELQLVFQRLSRMGGSPEWTNRVRRAAQRIADAVMEISRSAPEPRDLDAEAPAPLPDPGDMDSGTEDPDSGSDGDRESDAVSDA